MRSEEPKKNKYVCGNKYLLVCAANKNYRINYRKSHVLRRIDKNNKKSIKKWFNENAQVNLCSKIQGGSVTSNDVEIF